MHNLPLHMLVDDRRTLQGKKNIDFTLKKTVMTPVKTNYFMGKKS